MQSRLEYAKATPGAVKAMRGLESYVYKRGTSACSLNSSRLGIPNQRLRVLRDMHAKDARTRGDPELVNLTLAIVAINAWSRLAIAFHAVPGTHQLVSARSECALLTCGYPILVRRHVFFASRRAIIRLSAFTIQAGTRRASLSSNAQKPS